MSLDYRHLMQENIDGALQPEYAHELLYFLERDQKAAQENAQLQQLHERLSSAPQMRAPGRLAATIMARLAKSIETHAQLQQLPDEIRLALVMSISIVQMAMMPVMIAASQLVLMGVRSPELISRVLERSIALMVMMIDALILLLEEIERMIEKDPEHAPLAMSLIPIALMGMLEYLQGDLSDQDLLQQADDTNERTF
jgi:antitoxin component HigA of HigAB toxin-antitoxin module